jgi:hypothetical protein
MITAFIAIVSPRKFRFCEESPAVALFPARVIAAVVDDGSSINDVVLWVLLVRIIYCSEGLKTDNEAAAQDYPIAHKK